MKFEWGKKKLISYHTRKRMSGIAWCRTGIWKFRGLRSGVEEGIPPLL
jgi:hypothetical protein